MSRQVKPGLTAIIGLHGLVSTLMLGYPASIHATQAAGNGNERIYVIGVLAHDRGPFSDHHEHGIDLNLEVQFAPLNFKGSPRPHLGVEANNQGETSVAYAGLGFRLYEKSEWFVDGLLGLALHDGPLHKDPVGCRENSDCGYGIRLLPRFGLEVGYRLSPISSVSVLFDHMSHRWLVPGENEGLDHIGVRYRWAY